MSEQIVKGNHGIILENRQKLSVSGVIDVIGFDEETVVLKTQLGDLTVKGNGLKVQSFAVETGGLLVEGNIAAIVYTENRQKRGIASRLFG
ncbi:MAG: sporulation protein YabP [Clostridia bacterium]|nr:sporulation protein YabP [Clostridia bacterium]